MSIIDAVIAHQTGFLKPKPVNEKGYLTSLRPEDNLIERFPNWEEIKKELNKGKGSELKGKLPKFCSVRSSSALCVNNFAPFKQYYAELSFLGYSRFSESLFEKQQPTGLEDRTPPHLDFYLENKTAIIGIESKFTEYFGKKKPNHGDNLRPYLDGWNTLKQHFSDLSADFRKEILEHYAHADNNESQYLDVAQLIKHTIGLRGNRNGKKVILVYLYWEPLNPTVDKRFAKYHKRFAKHQSEIADFKCRIERFIEFVPLSYPELWKRYENDALLKEHIGKVRERYGFPIKS